mgnify:CR=1 FL=1
MYKTHDIYRANRTHIVGLQIIYLHLSLIHIKSPTRRFPSADAGVGVELPPSLSGGLASRLGLSIKAELPERSRGFTLGECLDWEWDLMIGGVTLTLRELERLSGKRSPLVRHKGAWIELRPNDLKNAERFCGAKPELSLDDALRLCSNLGHLVLHDLELALPYLDRFYVVAVSLP